MKGSEHVGDLGSGVASVARPGKDLLDNPPGRGVVVACA